MYSGRCAPACPAAAAHFLESRRIVDAERGRRQPEGRSRDAMGAERELHFDFVDGLRAVAVVAVMLYHLDAALLPGGFVGVDVFFVVSGFVVSASLAGHRAEAALAFLARFYARRLARLMPALLTMLVATIAAYVLLVPRAWFNRAADDVAQAAFWGFSNLVLDHQAVSYFEPRAELNPFTHTWSLGVEEQFYLVAPLLLLWAFRSEARPAAHSRAVGLLALLAALSLAACLHHGVVQGARHVFYPLVFRFWELATGVLLFVGRPALARLAARWDPAGGRSAAAGGLLLAACLLAPKPQFHPYLRAAGAVAATALLIGAARLPMRDGLRGALAHTALVWIGLRSYALYLWHWPVYVLARWTIGLGTGPLNAIALCVTLLLATASYRFIEQPFRRSPRLAAWPPRRRITLGLAMIAAGSAAGAALLAHQAELGLGRVTREAADWYPERQLLKTARAAQRRCEPVAHSLAAGPRQARGTRYEPVSCPVRAAGQLFVIGDSHATAYAPLFEQLSAEEGRRHRAVGAGLRLPRPRRRNDARRRPRLPRRRADRAADGAGAGPPRRPGVPVVAAAAAAGAAGRQAPADGRRTRRRPLRAQRCRARRPGAGRGRRGALAGADAGRGAARGDRGAQAAVRSPPVCLRRMVAARQPGMRGRAGAVACRLRALPRAGAGRAARAGRRAAGARRLGSGARTVRCAALRGAARRTAAVLRR